MSSPVTKLVARLLLAPVLIIAVAVLVKGYADVGDGFAAGMIAALGLLLQYLAFGREEVERTIPVDRLPALAFFGMLLALAVAMIPLLRGDSLFTHSPAPGADVVKVGTLELITAVAFDLAVFLLVIGAAVGIIRAIALAGEEEA